MSGKLHITDIEYHYMRDDSIAPDGPRDFIAAIRGANVHCNSCGRDWHTASGRERGQFREIPSGFEIECPDCGERDVIRPRD